MPDRFPKAYAARLDVLTQRMTKYGLSIGSLAQVAVVSSKTINRILKGKRASLRTYQKLAKVLQIKDCNALLQTDGDSTVSITLAYRIIINITDAGPSDPLAVAERLVHQVAPLLDDQASLIIERAVAGSVIAHARANSIAAESLLYLFCIGMVPHLRGYRLRIRGTPAIDLASAFTKAHAFLASTDSAKYIGYRPPNLETYPRFQMPALPAKIRFATQHGDIVVHLKSAEDITCVATQMEMAAGAS